MNTEVENQPADGPQVSSELADALQAALVDGDEATLVRRVDEVIDAAKASTKHYENLAAADQQYQLLMRIIENPKDAEAVTALAMLVAIAQGGAADRVGGRYRRPSPSSTVSHP